MQIIDLQAQYTKLKEEIDAGIKSVLSHGQFIMGPEVRELEGKLADYVGVKHCIACANGTDALQVLYMAYGIGHGDAVFCSDVTFVASTEPAYMFGAIPVFCDINNETYNISPQSLEWQIKAVIEEGKYKPKAVVAVDIFGNPADYDSICEICSKYDIILIEDAAQSFGASYKGKRCGAFGQSATTSFFPTKPLGCYGDGGAIFTNDDVISDICRSLCVHGKGPGGKYDNVRIGLNSRLDTLQAAILLPKLKALKEYEMDRRQIVAWRYNNAFEACFATPFVPNGCLSAWAQYTLLAKDSNERNRIIVNLNKKEIPNMVYYPASQHMLPVFVNAPKYLEEFKNSIDYCARTFSLPMHPYLDEESQDKVIAAVLQAIL